MSQPSPGRPSATPLRALLRRVLTDDTERARFTADPDGYLARHGQSGLTTGEVLDAVAALSESLPAPLATRLREAVASLDATGDAEVVGFGSARGQPGGSSILAALAGATGPLCIPETGDSGGDPFDALDIPSDGVDLSEFD